LCDTSVPLPLSDVGFRHDATDAGETLGYADSAFAMLQTARWDVPTLIELRASPLLERFRADPRYTALLQRSGLEF
jgi:hypothetical protein